MRASCSIQIHANALLGALRSLRIRREADAIAILAPAPHGILVMVQGALTSGHTDLVCRGRWSRRIAVPYGRLIHILATYGDAPLTLTFFEGTIVIGGTRIPALDLSPPAVAPRVRPARARQLCLPGMLADGELFAAAPWATGDDRLAAARGRADLA